MINLNTIGEGRTVFDNLDECTVCAILVAVLAMALLTFFAAESITLKRTN